MWSIQDKVRNYLQKKCLEVQAIKGGNILIKILNLSD
jgi:hypothetical protein